MACSCTDEARERPHGELALCFMFVGLSVGSIVTYLISRYAHSIPYTVVLFLLGILLIQGVLFFDFQVLGESVEQWGRINPHLLLFTFLPALLFGEAMSLNIHNIKLTYASAALMAGPGAIFGTIVVAALAYNLMPYGWSLPLCLTFGSILCATDPVAVVAVLKQLGASPRMTMLVTLEALMNDGAALVLYNLFFASLLFENEGESASAGEVVIYFVEVLCLSPLIGIAFGLATCAGFALARERMKHDDITIQISITLCCAYLSFFVAEHVVEVSGVLACCTAGVVVAWFGPPLILEHESMHSVWGMCEWIGNTLIFLLAGVLFGETLEQRTGQDFLVMIVVYLFLHIIRGAMFVLLYPAISRLGCGVTVNDCYFMTYGGLRGAVGIALALALQQETDEGLVDIEKEDSHRLFFIVGGVAALTLLVNATSAQSILGLLGLFEESSNEIKTMQHYARKRIHKGITELILDLHDELPAYSEELVAKFCNIVAADDEDLESNAPDAPADEDQPSPATQARKRAVASGTITPQKSDDVDDGGISVSRQNTTTFLKRVNMGQVPATMHEHMNNVQVIGVDAISINRQNTTNFLKRVNVGMSSAHLQVLGPVNPTDRDRLRGGVVLEQSEDPAHRAAPPDGSTTPGGSIAPFSSPQRTESQDAADNSEAGTPMMITVKRHGTFNFLNQDRPKGGKGGSEGSMGDGSGGVEMQRKPGGRIDLSNQGDLSKKSSLASPSKGASPPPALHKASSMHRINSMLHTEEIAVNTGLNEQLMVHVRSAFLNVLRSSYWKLIEEGKIPRSSPVALNLLTSIDIALDDVRKIGFHDWDYLEPLLKNPHAGSMWVSTAVDSLTLGAEGLLKQVGILGESSYFHTSWGRYTMEWHDSHTINCLAAFISAHLRAQRLVKYYLGESAEAVTEEELLCVEESNKVVEEAKVMLQGYDTNTISYHVSKQVANIIVFTQEDIIHKLTKEGILPDKDAEVLLAETRINQKNLKRSWLATMFDRDASRYHEVESRPDSS